MAVMRSQPQEDDVAKNTYTAEERLYLSADGKVVKAGDPSAATLLAGAGDEIPMAQAEALGLVKAAAKPADKARKSADNK